MNKTQIKTFFLKFLVVLLAMLLSLLQSYYLLSSHTLAKDDKNNILIINQYQDLNLAELNDVFNFTHVILPDLLFSDNFELVFIDQELLNKIKTLDNQPQILLSFGRYSQIVRLLIDQLNSPEEINLFTDKLIKLIKDNDLAGAAFLFTETFEDLEFDEKIHLTAIIAQIREILLNNSYLVTGKSANNFNLYDSQLNNTWEIGTVDKYKNLSLFSIDPISHKPKSRRGPKNLNIPKTPIITNTPASGSSSGGGSISANQNPTKDDQDQDGISDTRDNCPAIANYTQFDHDNDGLGNSCDIDYLSYLATASRSNQSSSADNFGYGYNFDEINDDNPVDDLITKDLAINEYCVDIQNNIAPYTGQNNCLIIYDETVLEERLDDSNYGIANSPLVTFNNHVYAAFVRKDPHNTNKYQTVIAKSITNGTWSFMVIDDNTKNDPYHNHPSLAVDKQGYIHIVYNMHNTPWQYKVSKNPEDISKWVFRGQYSGDNPGGTTASNSDCMDDCASAWYSDGTASIPGNQITYPNFSTDNHGELFLTYRECLDCKLPDNNIRIRASGLAKYDVNSQTWTRVANAHFIADENKLGQILHLNFDKNNDLFLSWVFGPHYNPDSDTYYAGSKYLGHAISNDGGLSFHTVNGTNYNLPITFDQYQEILTPEWALSQGEYQSGYTEIAALNGKPYISLRPRQLNRAWMNFDGNQWTAPTPLNIDNAYHFLINNTDQIFAVSSHKVHFSSDTGISWQDFTLWSDENKADKIWLDYVYSKNQTEQLRFLLQDIAGSLKLYNVRYQAPITQSDNQLHLPVIFGFSQPADIFNPGQAVKDQIIAQIAKGVFEIPIYPGGNVSPDGTSLALLGANPPDLSSFMNLLTEIENEDPSLSPNDLRLRVYIRASLTSIDAGPPANPNSPGKFELSNATKQSNLIDLINQLASGQLYNIDANRIDEFTLDFEDTTASNYDPTDIDPGDNIADSSITTIITFIQELKKSGLSQNIGLYSLGILNENWFPNENDTPGSPFAISPRNWISQNDLHNLFNSGLDVFEFAAYSIFPDLNGSGGFADPATYDPIHANFYDFISKHLQTIQALGKDPVQNLRILIPVYTDPNVIDLSTALTTLQNLIDNQATNKIFGGVFDFGALDETEKNQILNSM